ncbi:MAG: hypothetical protein ACR2ND_09895 [Solirubrobacteraceae bacterium]
MRRPATPQPDVKAALVGFAAGLRTFTPPALVVVRRRGPGGAHLALMAFPLLAGIEYVWDKHPAATSRLERPALAARLVSGASTGRIVGGGARGALVGGAPPRCLHRSAMPRGAG